MSQICPKCGANWEAIADCLHSDTYDRELAICILNNCSTCQEHFDSLLPIYSRLEISLVRGGVENAILTREKVKG